VPDNRIWIVCSDLTVTSGGAINANGKGYIGGRPGGLDGSGPGGGGSVSRSGGYGGFGGNGGGGTYGSATAPTDPGSGGGGWSTSAGGGNGGGAILIDASGAVVVDGTISADGDTGYANNCGGGSGGSIYITCNTFSGNGGIVRAKGGNKQIYSNSSGGGGRIAVIYDTGAQALLPVPSVVFSAAPGAETATLSRSGDVGTLYFPDSRFLAETIVHSGQWMAPGFDRWAPENLIISNAWIRFIEQDFELTVSNSFTMLGGNIPLNRFDITPASISCGGDFVITNISGVTSGSYVYLYMPSNSIPSEDGCGASVTVGGTLSVSPNSVIYPHCHPTNGAGVGFYMRDFVLSAGAKVNADTLGFAGGTNLTDHGKGPGRTLSTGFAGGSGYGGTGGCSVAYNVGGVVYGSSNAPVHPGSGSGYSSWGPGPAGVAGGGMVRLTASRSVILNGAITANGGAPSLNWGGSSGGGGIYIYCRWFSGSGSLSARGANSPPYHGGGAGGGGRIAVWREKDMSSLSSVSVAGGAAGSGTGGGVGTIVWVDVPPPGTVLMMQ
jgi:hypothetical protein